jgi:hypothetical protein
MLNNVVPVLEHHTVNMHGVVEVKICAFLTFALGGYKM